MIKCGWLAPFNRTSVELKLATAGKPKISSNSFNRTSVELKHESRGKLEDLIMTFNRTSVELKLFGIENERFFFKSRLLIEPVWN